LRIRATQTRIGRHARQIAECARRGFPRGFIDHRDLPLAALIGVAGDTASRDELRRLHGMHRPALEALEPDREKLSRFVHGRL